MYVNEGYRKIQTAQALGEQPEVQGCEKAGDGVV